MYKYLHGEKMPATKGASNLAEKKQSRSHWLETEAGQICAGDEAWISTGRVVNQETATGIR